MLGKLQQQKTKVFKLNKQQLQNVYEKTNIFVSFANIGDLTRDMMLIQAFFGRGKSYYAIHKLLKDVNEYQQDRYLNLFSLQKYKPIKPCQLLILSPRKAIKQQQLNQQGVMVASQIDYENQGGLWYEEVDPDQKVRITTVQQFTEWIRRGKIHRPPKIIVIDQIHLLYKQSIYADSLEYFIDWLGENSKKLIKFGLTSTSFDIYNFYAKHIKEYGFIRIDAEIPPKYRIQKAFALASGNVMTCYNIVKPLINADFKALVFCRSAKECKRNAEMIGDQAGWMVSQYCQSKDSKTGLYLKDLMNKDLRNYVLDKQEFPHDINVLFITSAYQVGVNIKDQTVQCVISDSIDPDSIAQQIGRIRHNMKRYYLVCNGTNVKQKLNRWNQYVSLVKEYKEAKTDWDKNDILSRQYQKQKDAREMDKSIPKLVRKKRGEDHVYQWFPFGIASLHASYLHTLRFNNAYTSLVKVKLDGNEFQVDPQEKYLKDSLRIYCDDIEYLSQIAQQKKEQTNKNAYQAFEAVSGSYMDKWLDADEMRSLALLVGFVRAQGKVASIPTIIKEIQKNKKYYVEKTRKTKNKVKKTVYKIHRTF